MKGCFLPETLKGAEITSLALSPGFHFPNCFRLRRGEMLCPISRCLVLTESRGVLRDPWSRDPRALMVQREGTQPGLCISLLTSPAPGSSQQQRLWSQVMPRALPSPARIQFLGPVPKAAALFAQENTAEQRHSHTAKARPPLLWPHNSPLIPAWLDQAPGRACGTHSSQTPSACPSSFGSGAG